MQSPAAGSSAIHSPVRLRQASDKYTARREINDPAGNGQAGKAPDSRVKVPSSSPERRNFYYYNTYTGGNWFLHCENFSISECFHESTHDCSF